MVKGCAVDGYRSRLQRELELREVIAVVKGERKQLDRTQMMMMMILSDSTDGVKLLLLLKRKKKNTIPVKRSTSEDTKFRKTNTSS